MLKVTSSKSVLNDKNSPGNSNENQTQPSEEQLSPTSDDELARVRFLRRKLSVSGCDINLDGTENDNCPYVEPVQTIHKNKHCINEYYGKSQKGYVPYNLKKANQDRLLMKEDTDTGTIIFGVFDGHGEHGHCVSESISETFYKKLVKHELFKTDLKKAAIESLSEAEKTCVGNTYINSDLSGTTANIWIIRNTTLLTLNVGDSRGILISEKNNDLDVSFATKDHKPSLEEEKKRIEEAGGRVFSIVYSDGEVGPQRVWLKYSDIPGLAMSRSLGDCLSHTVGVISTPEIHEQELTNEDKIIVIATDGLWEFISNKEIIDVINTSKDSEEAVNTLSSMAWKRWYNTEQVVDDITIIVACLEDEDDDEMIGTTF